jgi:hypothetical protein
MLAQTSFRFIDSHCRSRFSRLLVPLEIIGSARGYELTGNLTQKSIASNFFAIVTQNHSFATGGSNDHEHWGAPNMMGDQLDGETEESCTTYSDSVYCTLYTVLCILYYTNLPLSSRYNILKVARHLFEWSADSALGEAVRLLWCPCCVLCPSSLCPYCVCPYCVLCPSSHYAHTACAHAVFCTHPHNAHTVCAHAQVISMSVHC